MNSIYSIDTINNFLKIIQTVVLNEEFSITDYSTFSWSKTYAIAKAHSLENILQYAVKYFPSEYQPTGKMEKLIMECSQMAISRDTIQSYEIESITKQFQSNNINFLQLKGALIKHLYPSSDMRQMSDLDIVVRSRDLHKVNTALQAIGYTKETIGELHVAYHKPPIMCIEVHYNNMVDVHSPLYQYFSNISEKVVQQDNGCLFNLTTENHFIFLIAHLYNHFIYGGIGLRALLDIYIFNREYNNIYKSSLVVQVLKQYGLYDFTLSVIKYANLFFVPSSQPIQLDKTAIYYVNSGTFGSSNGLAVNIMNSNSKNLEKSKIRYIASRVFPTYTSLKLNNPILDKAPFLLPCFYVKHWFNRLFLQKNVNFKRVNQNFKTINQVTEDLKDIYKSCGIKK